MKSWNCQTVAEVRWKKYTVPSLMLFELPLTCQTDIDQDHPGLHVQGCGSSLVLPMHELSVAKDIPLNGKITQILPWGVVWYFF